MMNVIMVDVVVCESAHPSRNKDAENVPGFYFWVIQNGVITITKLSARDRFLFQTHSVISGRASASSSHLQRSPSAASRPFRQLSWDWRL
jgi:hypothetical protein